MAKMNGRRNRNGNISNWQKKEIMKAASKTEWKSVCSGSNGGEI